MSQTRFLLSCHLSRSLASSASSRLDAILCFRAFDAKRARLLSLVSSRPGRARARCRSCPLMSRQGSQDARERQLFTARIKEQARALGFHQVGVARAEALTEESARLEE